MDTLHRPRPAHSVGSRRVTSVDETNQLVTQSLPVDAVVSCLRAEPRCEQEQSSLTNMAVGRPQQSLDSRMSPMRQSGTSRTTVSPYSRSVGRMQRPNANHTKHARSQSSSSGFPMAVSGRVGPLAGHANSDKTQLETAKRVFGPAKPDRAVAQQTTSSSAQRIAVPVPVPSQVPTKAVSSRLSMPALPNFLAKPALFTRPLATASQQRTAPTLGLLEQTVTHARPAMHAVPTSTTTAQKITDIAKDQPAHSAVYAPLPQVDVIERHSMSPSQRQDRLQSELMTRVLESPQRRASGAWPARSTALPSRGTSQGTVPISAPSLQSQARPAAPAVSDLGEMAAPKRILGKRKSVDELTSDARASKAPRHDGTAIPIPEMRSSRLPSRRSSTRLASRASSVGAESSALPGQSLASATAATEDYLGQLALLPPAQISENPLNIETTDVVMEVEKPNHIRDSSADTSALTEVGNESLAHLQSMLTRMAMPRTSSAFLAEHRRTSMLQRFSNTTNMLDALHEVPEQAPARPVQPADRRRPRYAAATASSTARARTNSVPQANAVTKLPHSASITSLPRRGSLLPIASNIRAAQAANARGDAVAATEQSEAIPAAGAGMATDATDAEAAPAAATPPKPVPQATHTLLKGVVAYVDVKTAEGDEAGGVFVDILRSLGARVSW